MKLTYKKAGVDIDTANVFVQNIKPLVKKTHNLNVVTSIGGFGGLFNFAKTKYKEPVLVSSTDGVGTKLKIAISVNKHNTVGIDLVGMNVNDVLCTGAEPLFFLDYIACGKLKPDVLTDVVRGIANGCAEAGCALIGGETAEMPGMYKEDDYDLAGFCVGVVERSRIIDGSKIEAGDKVIGLESNGLHSNGFSLVRKVFSAHELKQISSELLRPTKIYVKPVLSLLRNSNLQLRTAINGIAHITGGAFYDKISRILPDNINARINKTSWVVPKIFQLIQNKGGVENKEMYRTFNMGVGMVLIVKPQAAQAVISALAEFKLKSWIIGEAVKGKKEVEIV
ncbi:MAG: phosphoribosylformylglycinamidine cyclo-ligase [Candidatus Omnitrophica bacterium]|nr:phosphoribosylformylglycinamidine cyclo-ligase [Candidatus Omnitrophota bacterium]